MTHFLCITALGSNSSYLGRNSSYLGSNSSYLTDKCTCLEFLI